MKINVSQKHIDHGTPFISTSCPVAWAIRDAIGSSNDVRVYTTFSLINEHTINHPYQLRLFITDFDNCRIVEPREFELPLEDYINVN